LGDGAGTRQLDGVACIFYGISPNVGPVLEEQPLGVLMVLQRFTCGANDPFDITLTRWQTVT